uniref:Uncharacterized protein n=1 Tax=Rhizophora mucronata TaxID=61149 RepID=A0A2P2N9R4_RHIMU
MKSIYFFSLHIELSLCLWLFDFPLDALNIIRAEENF